MIRLVVALLSIWCVIPTAPSAAARSEHRRVLLLYSYEREFLGSSFAGHFRPELARLSPDPIDFIEISLQTARASRHEPDEATVERLRGEIVGRRLDLVMTIGGPAAVFARAHSADLFAGTPVLLASVDSRFLETRPLAANETAVTVHHDPPRLVESILRVLPDTSTIVVVIGASPLEQFWLDEVKRAFQRFEGRVNFVWTNQWTYEEMIRRCATLPPRSAIFYGVFSLDAAGVPRIETETLDALHASANAPLFGLHSSQLGHGILGGPLLSIEDLGRDTASVALRLLQGESPAAIPARTLQAERAIFDGRELRRWGIAESRLGPAHEVRFRAPSEWERYKGPIVVGLSVAAAQTLLVIALVVNLMRRRRRRAAPADPADLRPAEAALAALSRRLIQAREHERAHIARTIHDDVCQEFTALTLRLHELGTRTNGSAAELRTRIEELCGQFWTLEREILAISDPVYHQLALLGVAESARALCARRCTERGVPLVFRAAGVPDRVPEPIALALFRVLEEAVQNALSHAAPTKLSVTLLGTPDAIALDVVDDGKGFDVDAAIAAAAVGLIGMRERIRLVNGAITIESRYGSGTRIHAFAPLPSAGEQREL